MTQDLSLPDISLAEWRDTRDTLHQYARLAGKTRAAMTPRHKHWRHITLHASATGLTTTPMPANGKTLELLLDCIWHCFTLKSSYGEEQHVQFQGQSIRGVCDDLVAALLSLGASPDFDRSAFSDSGPAVYDTDAVVRFWHTFAWIDGVFKRFKGELREESGPVHVFPHHFDLSLKWFSGRTVPGADRDDEESADELMTFGFHTGDDSVPEMAIGRLPVVTEEELQEHLDKVFAYETSGGAWTTKVLMVADDMDDGGDFPADSDDVSALLPGSYTAEKVYVLDHRVDPSQQLSIDTAHQLTLDGINNGALLMNYMGHGGVYGMAQPPGSDTLAWRARATSGPRTRTAARMVLTTS